MIRRLLILATILLSQIASAEDEKPDPGDFPSIRSESAEIRACVRLCESFEELSNDVSNAQSTLASIRTMLASQLSRGSNPLRISQVVQSPNPDQEPHRSIPGIYSAPDDLPELIQTGFDSRKAAYMELAKATASIPELGPVSVCALHQLGELSDTVAFESLLGKFTILLAGNYANVINSLRLDSDRNPSLETTLIAVRLAVELDRMEDLRAIIKPVPEANYQALSLKERLENLATIYTHGSSDEDMRECADLIVSRKISFEDLIKAADFRNQAYPITVGILLSALDRERAAYLRGSEILQILERMPDGEDAVARKLIRACLDGEHVQQRNRQELAGLLISNEVFSARFKEFESELLEILISPSTDHNNLTNLLHLKQMAALLERRAAEDGIDDDWKRLGKKLIDQFLEYPATRGPSIDEAFARQLVSIVEVLEDPELLMTIVTRTAGAYTWPFELALRCLRMDETACAFAAMEHGKPDNLFPRHLSKNQTDDIHALIPLAAKFATENATQEETFLAMLLTETFLSTRPKEDLLKQAREVQDKVIRRWGEVDHSNQAYLQQGNRVLWRDQDADKSAAVPALRLWLEAHPVSEIVNPGEREAPISTVEYEVWRSCLTSGHFPAELAFLADTLTEAGISGDAVRHREITESLKKALASGGWSSVHPAPLSSHYTFVKLLLMAHGDPFSQKTPPSWSGILAEFDGLGMSDADSATAFLKVFGGLNDSNYTRGLSPLRRLGLLTELASLELPPEIDRRLFGVRWSIPGFSLLDQGTPQDVFTAMERLLRDHPNRDFWASFFFSFAYGHPFNSHGRRIDSKEIAEKRTMEWARMLQSHAAETWLEPVATHYSEHFKDPKELVLFGLTTPSAQGYLRGLPLGLRHQYLIESDLPEFLQEHLDQCDKILRMGADCIVEAMRTASPEDLGDAHSERGQISNFRKAILSRYSTNPEFYRGIYHKLKEASKVASATYAKSDLPGPAPALKQLSTLLLQIESADSNLEIRDPVDLSPSIPLISYLRIGEIEKALALIIDPDLEFGFDYPPANPADEGSIEGDQENRDQLYRESVENVLERIPASLGDRRIYFRILTSVKLTYNRQASPMSPFERSQWVPDGETIRILSDFDQHDFKDQSLGEACMNHLSRLYGVGGYLPLKLKAWRRPDPNAGDPRKTSGYLEAWCAQVVANGNLEEFMQLLPPLADSDRGFRSRPNSFSWRIGPVIRMAIQDALHESDASDTDRLVEMANEYLKVPDVGHRLGIRDQQQILRGSLLGHLLVVSESSPEISALGKELAVSDEFHSSAPAFPYSPMDFAIFAAAKAASGRPLELRLRVFERLWEIQSTFPNLNGSQAPHYAALLSQLLSEEEVKLRFEQALGEDPEKLRDRFDQAMLLHAEGDDETAIKRLQAIAEWPKTPKHRVDQRIIPVAEYMARKLTRALQIELEE